MKMKFTTLLFLWAIKIPLMLNFFTGQSYLNGLVAPAKDVNVGVGNVTFEPGCRNNWHIHHDGYQILLVTAGQGIYQEWNKPARLLKPGDVVVTHDGVKHWHGAIQDSWFAHVAITAGNPEWLSPVSNDEYVKANAEVKE